jgi:hypothetical protein
MQLNKSVHSTMGTDFKLKLYSYMNLVQRQKLRSSVRFPSHFPTVYRPSVANEPWLSPESLCLSRNSGVSQDFPHYATFALDFNAIRRIAGRLNKKPFQIHL